MKRTKQPKIVVTTMHFIWSSHLFHSFFAAVLFLLLILINLSRMYVPQDRIDFQ